MTQAQSAMDIESLRAILADKFIQIERMEKEVAELKGHLKNEMDVNAYLNDLNVELKGRLREAGQLMKVRVHPSSMKSLQDLVAEKQEKINTLRQTLEMAIKLIPDDRVRAPHLASIKEVYRQVL